MFNNNEEDMDASLNFCLPPYKSPNIVKLGFIAANIICNKKTRFTCIVEAVPLELVDEVEVFLLRQFPN